MVKLIILIGVLWQSEGISDECVRYYLGDMSELIESVNQLRVIDISGQKV
jgi:hypothetical protein